MYQTLMCLKTFAKNNNMISKIIYILLISSVFCMCNADTENLTNNKYGITNSNSSTFNYFATSAQYFASQAGSQNIAARTILRIYDDCTRNDVGFVPCLKKKAISFLDRISHIDAITIAEGVKLVRSSDVDADAVAVAETEVSSLQSNMIENDSETTVSRSGEDLDTKLSNMLLKRLSRFFSAHSIQVNFPKLSYDEIGRGLEEGRGKMKKMMSMMVMGMAMKMMGMIPVAMGALYMMAGKALIVSKIALLLAGIMGLKKMMSGGGGKGSAGGYSSGGWSSGGGGGGGSGGWDRRSFTDAQDLAYRSQRQLQHKSSAEQQPQQIDNQVQHLPNRVVPLLSLQHNLQQQQKVQKS